MTTPPHKAALIRLMMFLVLLSLLAPPLPTLAQTEAPPNDASSRLFLPLVFGNAAATVAAADNDDPSQHPSINLQLAEPQPAQVVEALLLRATDQEKAILDQWIVLFRPGTPTADELADGLVREHDGQLLFKYEHTIDGFAALLTPQAVDALRKNPNILLIEQDRAVTLSTSQPDATWGLDRIDQRELPLDSTYNYTSTGAGVNVYVIDSGIRRTHTEFGGRVETGFSACGGDTTDVTGHGTAVAGTIGGNTYGVAKTVKLYPVRVFGCGSIDTLSALIAGVDWVTANHMKPAVANMSLGFLGDSTTLDFFINRSIAAGVTYVVAAGNDNVDACTISPAHLPAALTVGATTATDQRASFSNFGPCLDLFAPGDSITTATFTNDTAHGLLSGTSFAAPHVAGVAALYLERNPTATPTQVAEALITTATRNQVINPGAGSPNRLLFAGLTHFDSTPPVITLVLTPATPDGQNGWYVSDVTVSFTCTDEAGGSGIASNTVAGATLSSEGANQTVTNTGQCSDNAGNVATAVTVSSLNIDKTTPTLNPIVNPNPVGLGSAASVTSGATDSLSGLASTSCGALDTNSVGVKHVTCMATDNAGSTTSTTVEYTVMAPSTLLQQVQTVRTNLAALLPSGDKKNDERLNKALGKLDQALAANLWEVDGNHLTLLGDDVFNRLYDTVQALTKLKNPAQAIRNASSTLATISRALAQLALDEAIAGQGDAKKIAKAQSKLSKGDSEVAKGKLDKAIAQYEGAWEYAQQALGISVAAEPTLEDESDTDAASDPTSATESLADDTAGTTTLRNVIFLSLVSR